MLKLIKYCNSIFTFKGNFVCVALFLVNKNRKGQNGENIVNREHKDEKMTRQRTVSKYQGFLLTGCLRRDFTEDTDVTCVP